MQCYFILHIVHISGTRMIEAVMNVILRGKNLRGMMRGLNTLQFIPLDHGVV